MPRVPVTLTRALQRTEPAKPETRQFVTSKTAKLFHDLFTTPECRQTFQLGTIMIYKTRCGKNYTEFEINDLAPRPSQTQCTKCFMVRETQIRQAIESAEREIRLQHGDTFYFDTWDEVVAIAALRIAQGDTIIDFEAESKLKTEHGGPLTYRVRINWYTAEQVELIAEDKALGRTFRRY